MKLPSNNNCETINQMKHDLSIFNEEWKQSMYFLQWFTVIICKFQALFWETDFRNTSEYFKQSSYTFKSVYGGSE